MKRKRVAKVFEVYLEGTNCGRRLLESARRYLLHSKKSIVGYVSPYVIMRHAFLLGIIPTHKRRQTSISFLAVKARCGERSARSNFQAKI